MKVLLLTDSLAPGGKERRLIELIKGFANYLDIELFLVVFSENIHYQEVYDLGIPVKILKRVPKRNPLVFYRLFKLTKKWNPDLIHSWGTMSAILAIPSSILLNIKLINGNIVNAQKDMHFFDKRLFRARLTFPFSSSIVSNSSAGLLAYKVPKKKGVCIYNGFDIRRISNLKDKDLIKKQFKIIGRQVVGMVGSFSTRKDYESYIKAGVIVLSQRMDITFIAVGDGPNLIKCKGLVPDKYASHFIFTGIQKDVESIINVFDVGVLSTNTHKHGEGISNAILEYMALGKPTVATQGGGTNEVIKDMKTGILIPPDSPQIMAEKILYLLNKPNGRVLMGLEGRKQIDTLFSLSKMTRAYYDLYMSHFV